MKFGIDVIGTAHISDLNQRLRNERDNLCPLTVENGSIVGIRPHLLPRVFSVRTAKPVPHRHTEHTAKVQFRYNEPLVLKCNVCVQARFSTRFAIQRDPHLVVWMS
jgi:hypothetical protein